MTLQRADAQVAQAEADYQFAQQDLIQRTSVRYFDVLAAQDTVDAAEAALEAFSRRLEQANKRFEVGLIAITDVQEARAAHDQAAAAVIAAKRSLATARELLRELTGESFDILATPIDDMPLVSPDPEDEEQWVSRALDQNLAVISARLATDIAKQDRARRPLPVTCPPSTSSQAAVIRTSPAIRSVGMLAAISRAPADQTAEQPIRSAFRSPCRSARAVLLRRGFAGSVYLHRAARERLERANRETERAARDAYLGVLSEISRVRALREALESSRTALQATGGRLRSQGLATTVDVLDAPSGCSRRRPATLAAVTTSSGLVCAAVA